MAGVWAGQEELGEDRRFPGAKLRFGLETSGNKTFFMPQNIYLSLTRSPGLIHHPSVDWSLEMLKSLQGYSHESVCDVQLESLGEEARIHMYHGTTYHIYKRNMAFSGRWRSGNKPRGLYNDGGVYFTNNALYVLFWSKLKAVLYSTLVFQQSELEGVIICVRIPLARAPEQAVTVIPEQLADRAFLANNLQPGDPAYVAENLIPEEPRPIIVGGFPKKHLVELTGETRIGVAKVRERLRRTTEVYKYLDTETLAQVEFLDDAIGFLNEQGIVHVSLRFFTKPVGRANGIIRCRS